MSSTGYELLGFAVWRAGRWYLRRRLGRAVSARRVLLGAAGVLGAGALVAVALSHGDSE